MRGLRYPESEKFENFFTMVQSTMYKSNCVFFLDTGAGNEFETEVLEGENLFGWVIPMTMADEFEAKFMAEVRLRLSVSASTITATPDAP